VIGGWRGLSSSPVACAKRYWSALARTDAERDVHTREVAIQFAPPIPQKDWSCGRFTGERLASPWDYLPSASRPTMKPRSIMIIMTSYLQIRHCHRTILVRRHRDRRTREQRRAHSRIRLVCHLTDGAPKLALDAVEHGYLNAWGDRAATHDSRNHSGIGLEAPTRDREL
jgi:hypothetical protein